MSFLKKQSGCGPLFCRKQGLGTPKLVCFKRKTCFFQQQKRACGRLFSRKQLLGVTNPYKNAVNINKYWILHVIGIE